MAARRPKPQLDTRRALMLLRDDGLTISQTAERLGVSRMHIAELFRRTFGYRGTCREEPAYEPKHSRLKPPKGFRWCDGCGAFVDERISCVKCETVAYVALRLRPK